MARRNLTVPDLGLEKTPIRVSLWLARRGARVAAGEPVVEVVAGAAAVELSAPADGVLAERLAAVDEPVAVGQCLGVIDTEDQPPAPRGPRPR